jgi:hypothetical protein
MLIVAEFALASARRPCVSWFGARREDAKPQMFYGSPGIAMKDRQL